MVLNSVIVSNSIQEPKKLFYKTTLRPVQEIAGSEIFMRQLLAQYGLKVHFKLRSALAFGEDINIRPKLQIRIGELISDISQVKMAS